MKLTWNADASDWVRKPPRKIPARFQRRLDNGEEVVDLPYQYTIGALEGEENKLGEYVLLDCPTYKESQLKQPNANTQRLAAAAVTQQEEASSSRYCINNNTGGTTLVEGILSALSAGVGNLLGMQQPTPPEGPRTITLLSQFRGGFYFDTDKKMLRTGDSSSSLRSYKSETDAYLKFTSFLNDHVELLSYNNLATQNWQSVENDGAEEGEIEKEDVSSSSSDSSSEVESKEKSHADVVGGGNRKRKAAASSADDEKKKKKQRTRRVLFLKPKSDKKKGAHLKLFEPTEEQVQNFTEFYKVWLDEFGVNSRYGKKVGKWQKRIAAAYHDAASKARSNTRYSYSF